MLSALDVAKHLIRVGYDPDHPEESVHICPLRLQKLLYYCQGWSLALLGRKLFDEPIQAWVEGPVVRSVYDQFKGSRSPIQPDLIGEPDGSLTKTEAALVEMVWKEYGRYTPRELVDKTHSEPAWSEARGGLPPTTRSTARLSEETMSFFFEKLASRQRIKRPGFPDLDPSDGWKADERAETSNARPKSASDVFGSLLRECANE
jgi:uncharacterized phage-associated protein